MQEPDGLETTVEEQQEARKVVLRVVIQSKLELGPSDHRSAKPWAKLDEISGKRARARRHGH